MTRWYGTGMDWLATFLMGLLLPFSNMAAVISHPEKPTPPPLPVDTSGHPLRIPIFIYHTIATGTPAASKSQEQFSTEPMLLDEQLTYIDEHGYTTVTMKEVADMLKRGTTSPIAKPVALTFDDGWQTQYVHAYPLLKKHHAKATFYIFPNPVGKDDRFMTWAELQTLRDDGMEIADHTLTHPLLSKQTPEMLHHEMYDSKVMLEKQLGITVTNFASPFGYTSPLVIEELKRDGYETGRTTNAGFMHAATSTYALDAYLVHKGMYDFTWALEHGK